MIYRVIIQKVVFSDDLITKKGTKKKRKLVGYCLNWV